MSSIGHQLCLILRIAAILEGMLLCFALKCEASEPDGKTPPFANSSKASDEDSPLTLFKTFVSNPPAVECTFSIKRPPSFYVPIEQHPFERSTNFSLFKASWQHQSILLFDAESESSIPEFARNRSITMVDGNEHWLFNNGEYVETTTDSPTNFANPVVKVVGFKLADLFPVLQGGILNIRPGDVKWNGETFIATSINPFNKRYNVEGKIQADGKHATGLILSYWTDDVTDGVAKWKITYSYERPLGVPFYPSQIRGYLILGTGEYELYRCSITALKAQDSIDSCEVFDRNSFVQLHKPVVQVFTNGLRFVLHPNGLMEEIVRSPGMVLPVSSASTNRGLSLSLISSFNIGFLICLRKWVLTQKTTKKGSTL